MIVTVQLSRLLILGRRWGQRLAGFTTRETVDIFKVLFNRPSLLPYMSKLAYRFNLFNFGLGDDVKLRFLIFEN